ncbi:MAG: polysaccharide deacetylase family protein [Anaerolineae bacterium]|nr:polysaccharide deacetylase family protein [Anaerolineae bacterium]
MTRKLALTFEAGGDPAVCGQMLDVLRRAGVPATIFLAGNWSEQYPELVRRMSSEGHELGNHSYSHPDLTRCGDAAVRDELRRTDAVVQQLTGQRPFPWFRPPYDAIDARVRQIAVSEGYRLVQRSAFDGGHYPGETTPEQVVCRSVENAYPGAVLTYHLDSPKTLAVLASILERLNELGFACVRLSDLPAVSERPERRPEFEALDIAPGYLQVLKRGARAWSLNVTEFGARANTPLDTPVALAATNGSSLSLLTGQDAADWKPGSEHDRYLLVLAGSVECCFRAHDHPDVSVRAVGSPGDLILWANGCELRAVSSGASAQSWIVLVFE